MGKGKLLVIDGLDGTGKTTQHELLKQSGVLGEALFVKFHTRGTDTGNVVTKYLDGKLPANPYAAAMFYAMDRYVSGQTDKWLRHYESGGVVIAERYVTSNAVYQSARLPKTERFNFIEWLYDLEYGKLSLPKPDRVFFLTMPEEVSKRLVDSRGEARDIHESDAPYRSECGATARYIAGLDGWETIDCVKSGALRNVDDIQLELVTKIKDFLD
ncbi:MAG: thymidylate kinase [Oscillospiraceae bacterium]|jgi:dTMP kinase|nr:thymidylate kinase [Oscillospiraceae bacterium]